MKVMKLQTQPILYADKQEISDTNFTMFPDFRP